MRFFILAITILAILNFGLAVEERIYPGQYKQFEFAQNRSTQTVRTFNLDPIDLSQIESLEISAQVFLRALPVTLQIYTLDEDGKKKYYNYNSEVSDVYPLYSDTSAVRIVELIKKQNLVYEDVEQKTPFCYTDQKTCTIKIDIRLSYADHKDLPKEDTSTGSLIYSIQYKSNSSYLQYGPFFTNQKDALDLKTTSLAYSWVMADGDRSKIMQYKLVSSITKKDKHHFINLLQTKIAQDSFMIKVLQQPYPCSPENQPCDWTWPTLTEQEQQSLKNQTDNTFAHSYLGNCQESACHYSVSVFIKSKMQRDNGFYIDIPSETDFPRIDFQEGVPKVTTYKFDILQNNLFKYHYLQFKERNLDDKQLSIAVRGDHFKELQYEVIRFDNKSNLIGKFQNDEFAMLNPRPDVKYIIFTYGDPKISVNVELVVKFMPIDSLLINNEQQNFKTAITFQSNIANNFYRKQGNIFKVYKVKSDFVNRINFKFELEKSDSSPDTNLDYVTFYLNHAYLTYEAPFPQNNAVDFFITGLTENNQTQFNNLNYKCNSLCYLLIRLENKNTHNTTLNMYTSYNELPDPNKDDGNKGGLGPGGIVGIVLGTIIGVSLLGFFGLRYYRKKKTESEAYKNMEYNNDLEDIDETNNDNNDNTN